MFQTVTVTSIAIAPLVACEFDFQRKAIANTTQTAAARIQFSFWSIRFSALQISKLISRSVGSYIDVIPQGAGLAMDWNLILGHDKTGSIAAQR